MPEMTCIQGREEGEDLDLDLLVREHLRPLRGYLAAQGIHTSLIDDVAQDVFLQAFQHLDGYDRTRPFRAWLFGIARNLVHQEYRKYAVDSRARNDLAAQMLIEAKDTEGDVWSGIHRLMRKEALAALAKCVNSLSALKRKLVDLRFGQREGTQQIAALLGMGHSAVRMALLRVRQNLMECVEKRLDMQDVTP